MDIKALNDFKLRSDESAPPDFQESATWKILSIEDNNQYQSSLVFTLRGFHVLGKPVELLTAQSILEATEKLRSHKDIAVILLDIVMEEDDSGIKFIQTIREQLNNQESRIIVLTGQPGMAPRDDLLQSFDIDDYCEKSQITGAYLKSIITANVRNFDQIRKLNQARLGLQIIINNTQNLSRLNKIDSFSDQVLEGISELCHATDGGIVCVQKPSGVNENKDVEKRIIAISGPMKNSPEAARSILIEKEFQQMLERAEATGQHQFDGQRTLLYFDDSQLNGNIYIVLVLSRTPISETLATLLQVYCENIKSGLVNVTLFEHLQHLAYRDSDLNIFNRNQLEQEISLMLATKNTTMQLLLVQLKSYDEVKSVFGYAMVIDSLKLIKERIEHTFSDNVCVARASRSVIAVLLPSHHTLTSETVDNIFGRLYPNKTNNCTERRIGVRTVVYPIVDEKGKTADQHLSDAELHLEVAKNKNLNFYPFISELRGEVKKQLLLVDELKEAIAHRQLDVAYQPKFRIDNLELIGFEALARWQKDNGEWVRPDYFISIAEKAGLIESLDTLIFDKICTFNKQLQNIDSTLLLAFNLSIQDLKEDSFISGLIQRYQSASLSNNNFIVEVTETQAMQNFSVIETNLIKLRQHGFKVSIDDFGTGYSSLSHLARLPADILKIDRVFVNEINQQSDTLFLIDTIIRLGKHLKLEVLAEGIETEEQRSTLADLGCELGQGYWYAKPMTPENAIAFIKSKQQ
ncbi:EAL domain-containing protein [Pleionea litopenaei]|uniref:EAL domain-containing protein n=1 Tax=Pleionea litopenaei TaxID=3070815 RepID=A0AA51RSN9_9GAMM|nr:EAL domain-containing protein [Pleionea sp. HL-JVS1]WMS86774.1 EAL domain-containing protein [Pleionea sp. HL-JVS1]